MKKFLNLPFFAVIASMMVFTACSSDESIEQPYTPEPVNLGVSVGSITVDKALTRATATATTAWSGTIDDTFASGDVVAIYTTDADDVWYKKSYATSAASGSAGAVTALTIGTGATDVFYWKGKSDAKKFHAYSFGNTTAITNTAVEIPCI